MNTEKLFCLYTQGALNINTILNKTDDGLMCPYSKQTLTELLAEYPDSKVIHFDDAIELIQTASRAHYCKGWKEINEEKFWYALEVLPPCKWVNNGSSEAFHVSERLTGSLVDWYARVGERYFTKTDDCTLTAQAVIDSAATEVQHD